MKTILLIALVPAALCILWAPIVTIRVYRWEVIRFGRVSRALGENV